MLILKTKGQFFLFLIVISYLSSLIALSAEKTNKEEKKCTRHNVIEKYFIYQCRLSKEELFNISAARAFVLGAIANLLITKIYENTMDQQSIRHLATQLQIGGITFLISFLWINSFSYLTYIVILFMEISISPPNHINKKRSSSYSVSKKITIKEHFMGFFLWWITRKIIKKKKFYQNLMNKIGIIITTGLVICDHL